MQLTVRDVARILSTSEKSVYRWIETAGLPAYRVNRQYRFSRAELLDGGREDLAVGRIGDQDRPAPRPVLRDRAAQLLLADRLQVGVDRQDNVPAVHWRLDDLAAQVLGRQGRLEQPGLARRAREDRRERALGLVLDRFSRERCHNRPIQRGRCRLAFRQGGC